MHGWRRTEFIASAALVAAFVLFVTLGGTPALRHDWMWPVDRAGFVNVLSASFSGWISDGIGNATPRMLEYVINLPIVLVGWVAGPMAALVFFSAAIASVVAYGAKRMCSALQVRDSIVRIAAAMLALFNPWTYDHIVAGHMAMVLSYGASLALLSFVLDKRAMGRADQLEAVCFVALAMPQLQLFLIDSVLVVALAVRRRMFLPLISYAIAFVPTAIGILTSAPDLASTPFTQDWERAQSVPLRSAWALGGYFAGYDTHTPSWGFHSLQIALLIATAAAVLRRQKQGVAALAAVGVVVLVVSGAQGPLAGAFAHLFEWVTPIRAFRELHDLLAFALCGYVVLLGLGARSRWVSVPVAGLCLVYAVSWVAAPPFEWWVDGRSVERLPVSAVQPSSRFALFPAFQPLEYLGKGSGVDVQALAANGTRSPLNEVVPLYPTSIALARYRRDGDTALLKQLSVSAIFERPAFSSLATTFTPGAPRKYSARITRLENFVPLLSRCASTALVGAQPQLGSCDRFYADAVPSLHASVPSSNVETADPGREWVDVRLVFPRYPDLGEPFGGVYTESRSAIFRAGRRALLVRTGGTLRANGRPLLSTNRRLTWITLPEKDMAVQCAGQCLIALEADAMPPHSVPDVAAAQPFRAESIRQLTAWWSSAVLAAGGIIRYNVRYEPHWIAFDRCGVLTHFRVDAVVNGWVGHPSQCGTTTILYWPAAVQLAAAIPSALWFYALFLAYASMTFRRIASNRSPLRAQE